MTNSTSIQKRGARTVANIFKVEVLNSQFSFNHVSLDDVEWADCWTKLFECNGGFPTMTGYSMSDDRSRYNGGEGHWSDNYTFFGWKDYANLEDDNPEFMIGSNLQDDYVADGISKYWNGSIPNYKEHIKEWGIEIGGCGYYTYKDSDQKDQSVPLDICSPYDETSTDIMRREQYYIKHLCIWGLKKCHCSSSGTFCNKVESEICGYKVGSISYV
jgi:hypothetical protein